MPVFEMATEVACTAEALFAYHARAGALTRLTPPFDRTRAVEEIPRLENGARAILELGVGPVWTRWVASHERVEPGRGFVDVMVSGPFRSWRHEHIFEPRGDRAVLVDRITYEPPAGPFGELVVESKLARSFAYRHATTRLDAALLGALPVRPMTVGITGASGLIGAELASLLRVAGHSVRRFARGATTPGHVRWNPSTGEVGPEANGLDAVVHLAGEPIAGGRLDDAHRARVRASRVEATELLVRALGALPQPPKVLVCASAVGVYGNRGDEVLEDDAAVGTGFLAEVCRDWEAAARQGEASGMRVAMARIGVVLSPAGGALEKMLPAFQAGLGGRMGSGQQWMPVVAIDDVGAMLYRAVVSEGVRGSFNAVGPEPVRNAQLTKLLGQVLHRPTPFVVPKVALKALFGSGLADEALLSSQRAVPSRVFSWGHAFRHPTAEDALRHVLGRPAAPAGTPDTRPSSDPPPAAP